MESLEVKTKSVQASKTLPPDIVPGMLPGWTNKTTLYSSCCGSIYIRIRGKNYGRQHEENKDDMMNLVILYTNMGVIIDLETFIQLCFC